MNREKNITHHQHLRWFQHETFVGTSGVASGSFSKTETHYTKYIMNRVRFGGVYLYTLIQTTNILTYYLQVIDLRKSIRPVRVYKHYNIKQVHFSMDRF